MKKASIKNYYHSNYIKEATMIDRDYSNQRLFETFDTFFSRILMRPFGGRLLDVGCGDGSFVEFCRRQGLAVKGVDTSDGVIL